MYTINYSYTLCANYFLPNISGHLHFCYRDVNDKCLHRSKPFNFRLCFERNVQMTSASTLEQDPMSRHSNKGLLRRICLSSAVNIFVLYKFRLLSRLIFSGHTIAFTSSVWQFDRLSSSKFGQLLPNCPNTSCVTTWQFDMIKLVICKPLPHKKDLNTFGDILP